MASSKHATAAAALVKKLATVGDGSLNFNFAASFNVPQWVPFFPVAKHGSADGKMALGVGLQLVGVLANSAKCHTEALKDSGIAMGTGGVLLGPQEASIATLNKIRADLGAAVLEVQRTVLRELAACTPAAADAAVLGSDASSRDGGAGA